MTRAPWPRRGRVVLAAATLAGLVFARPWTILPIEREPSGPVDASA